MVGIVGAVVFYAWTHAVARAVATQPLLLQGPGSILITLAPQQLVVADDAEEWADQS